MSNYIPCNLARVSESVYIGERLRSCRVADHCHEYERFDWLGFAMMENWTVEMSLLPRGRFLLGKVCLLDVVALRFGVLEDSMEKTSKTGNYRVWKSL